MRAARTDKGVSAIGQVVSLKMIIEPEGIVQRINDNLPDQIRVLGYKRVTNGFDSRKHCDKRRYEYILPAWALAPSEKQPAAAVDASAPSPASDLEPFVFDDACVSRMTEILSQYKGTHNFHNFTVRTSHAAPDVKRYILSFVCEGVADIGGEPWVKLVVVGQSFMLHQIRKMVGMAVLAFKGLTPPEHLKLALETRACEFVSGVIST